MICFFSHLLYFSHFELYRITMIFALSFEVPSRCFSNLISKTLQLEVIFIPVKLVLKTFLFNARENCKGKSFFFKWGTWNGSISWNWGGIDCRINNLYSDNIVKKQVWEVLRMDLTDFQAFVLWEIKSIVQMVRTFGSLWERNSEAF